MRLSRRSRQLGRQRGAGRGPEARRGCSAARPSSTWRGWRATCGAHDSGCGCVRQPQPPVSGHDRYRLDGSCATAYEYDL